MEVSSPVMSVVMFDPHPSDGKTNFGLVRVTALRKFKLQHRFQNGKVVANAKDLATADWDVS